MKRFYYALHGFFYFAPGLALYSFVWGFRLFISPLRSKKFKRKVDYQLSIGSSLFSWKKRILIGLGLMSCGTIVCVPVGFAVGLVAGVFCLCTGQPIED